VFQIQSKSGLKTALLLGAATASAMSLSTMARAQEQVETVVVTGSRIPQVGLYSSSPVTAVSNQEIKYEGTTSVETLLNNLPGVFADFTDTASNGATGQATVNLRGLGAARTLVLVDGKRLMPSDPANPVADLNQVPAALVDHVEVLTGGASAVYGSDAEGGVVNFIMRKDFEGVEVDAQYSVNNAANDGNSHGVSYDQLNKNAGFKPAEDNWWGGATTEANLLMGVNTADGKGNITAYAGYRNVQAVLQSSRDFSTCSLTTDFSTNLFCSGSSNYNRWISWDDLLTGNPGQFFGGDTVWVPYSGGNPAMKFNYGALNYLQRPDTRYDGGYFAHYQVNPSFDVYSSFMFADDHTLAQIAPSGAFLGSGPAFFPGTISPGYVQLNCDNPVMTVQQNQLLCGEASQETYQSGPMAGRFDGAGNLAPGLATLWLGRRDIEGGNRIDDLRHTSYRIVVGAKGDIGHGWAYDVYGQYGTTIYAETYSNEWSKQRVENALNVNPLTGNCFAKDLGIDQRCVPLDLFHGFGAVTKDQLAYVGAQGFKEGSTEERVVSGALTGDFGEWGIQFPWAKDPVGLALGAEYRSESLELRTSRDYQINDLYGQGAATLPVPKSGFNVEEGFGEVRLPIVQDMPLAQDLTVSLGYRYSTYNTAGSVESYKYGAEWQPIDDFRLRGSYQRAVRAPNVLESFAPLNVALFGGQDPCAGNSPTQQCIDQGVVNAQLCPAAQCNAQFGGNLALKPESSDTWSLGVVLTPNFMPGFTATIDYFDIKVKDYISVIDPNVTLSGCYSDTSTAESRAFFCPFVHRTLGGTGSIFGAGFVDAVEHNLNSLATSGVDFEANYNTSFEDWGVNGAGGLSINFIGTLLDTLETTPTQVPVDPAFPSYDCAGLFGVVCGTPNPKWRHKMRVTWTSPWDFGLSLQWRHLAGVKLDENTDNSNLNGLRQAYCAAYGICFDPVDAKLPAMDYFDISATVTVHTGLELRVGVDNLFDKEPPTVDSNTWAIAGPPFGNGNTYPGVYDSLGRTIFIGVTAKY
jgi:outer membrane receptor protein involved in Fe transport